MNRIYKEKIYFLGAFFIPIVILILLFIELGIAPFGPKDLLMSDLGAQYTPFFAHLKSIVTGNEPLMYSFSIGMGDSLLPLAAYYLMSPFNLLFFFASTATLDSWVTIVLMLKIASASFAMAFYLKNKFQKTSIPLLALSVVFAFNGFVGIYLTNIMWIDGVILLPFVVWSLERLVKMNRGKWYFFFLFLTIFTNYYLGYMTCIFSIFYYLYYSMLHTSFRNLREYIVKTKTQLFSFIKYSFFAGMSTCFLLLPAIVGMLSTGKTKFNPLTFMPYPKFTFEIFMQLGWDNTNFESRLAHLPSFYVGLGTILLVGLLFTTKMSKKEMKLRSLLLLSIFLSFWIQLFNAVWHMFQETAGFPYRNSYMFAFLLLVFAYESWEKREEFTKKKIINTSLVVLLLLSVGYLSILGVYKVFEQIPEISNNDMIIRWYLLVISALFILIYTVLLLQRRKRFVVLLFFLLLLGDGVGNFIHMVMHSPYSSSVAFKKTAKKVTEISDKLDDVTYKKNRWLYRVENQIPGIDTGYNQSLLSNYYAIPSYSSTLNNQLRKTLQDLGMFSRNERRISDLGLTNFTSYLFDVNYRLTDEKDEDEIEIAHTNNAFAYQVNHRIGQIGYFFDDSFQQYQLKTKEAPENLNQLSQMIMGNMNFSLFDSLGIKQESLQEWVVTPKEKGTLYLYLPQEKFNELEVFVNGEKVITKIECFNYALISLGKFDKDEKVRIEVIGAKHPEKIYEGISMIVEKTEDKVIDKLYKNRWKEHYKMLDNKIVGECNLEKEKILFTSIPFDKRWKVKIDGKKVDAIPVLNDAFVGVKVPKGKHSIELTYVPTIFYFSFIVSACSVIVFIAIEWKGTNKGTSKN